MRKEVYIIGGGNSLKDFNFNKLKDKDTIVVNKAIKYVPNPTYFITMDFTALKKIDCDLIAPSIFTRVFIANFAKPYLTEKNGQIVDTRSGLVYTLNDFTTIIKSYEEEGIGTQFYDFRSGNNSGYCALQLAVLLGYDRIYLLGMDLLAPEQTHFHGGYGESKEIFNLKLEGYYTNFVTGLKELKEKCPNIQVYSCSKISRLKDILPYKEI